ncbi:unnamed protein product [Chrysodeixis includens]|uniref:Uncharacterized protein n=1 Tax=Chrysodeixis includens TaxID=689277 RepID=A0A9N8L263_CHRIL|nr:unnamed protein product [Chrysodeixis includens]
MVILILLVIPLDLEAKTFSLNEAIAAESQLAEVFEPTLPPVPETTKRYSLLDRLASKPKLKLKSLLKKDYTDAKKISPLKYRKAFQIKSPLRPKRLNLVQQAKYKRKNQSAKREINGNDKLKQKYIPFLKSLSMLFDNLLNSDTSESREVRTKKFKRNRYYSGENEVPCDCASSATGKTSAEPREKAITSAAPPSLEIAIDAADSAAAETAPTTTDNSATRNFGTFRQHKDIPVLLARNTPSSGRDHNGLSERSGATLHRNLEGDITGDHGHREHVATFREKGLRATRNETNTDDVARNGTSGFRYTGAPGLRLTRVPPGGHTADKDSETEASNDSVRENWFEARRNETASPKPVPESFRRLRGFVPDEISLHSEPVQPEEVRKESHFSFPNYSAGYKRVPDKNVTFTAEDTTVREGNETMKQVDLKETNHTKNVKKNSPVVIIYDGYSVTRDKNGINKYSETTIRIHSKNQGLQKIS